VIFGDFLAKLEVEGALWLAGDKRIADIKRGAVTKRSIPKPSRLWHLTDNDALPPRDTESYSSLSTLFKIPVSWVLKYEGCLRQGAIQSIGNINAIMGSVAHRVFEELFPVGTDCKGWEQVSVQNNVDKMLSRLIETEGSVFLQPFCKRKPCRSRAPFGGFCQYGQRRLWFTLAARGIRGRHFTPD
jgi:hypothetical protein